MVPDLFLIGAPKCGTTALSHWLRSHPDIFVPDVKEPHFYSGPWADRHKRAINCKADYDALFEGAVGLTVDASTSYLASDKAYAALKNTPTKIIVCLRNPLKQLWSGFLMMEKFGERDPDAWIQEQIAAWKAGEWREPIESALYGKYVPRWLGHECLIIESARMLSEPQAVFDEVCNFLNVKEAPVPDLNATDANQFRAPKNGLAKQLMSSRAVTRIARAVTTTKVRTKIGDKLLALATKPEIPASWQAIKPIFEADLELLRAETRQPFPTLGP